MDDSDAKIREASGATLAAIANASRCDHGVKFVAGKEGIAIECPQHSWKHELSKVRRIKNLKALIAAQCTQFLPPIFPVACVRGATGPSPQIWTIVQELQNTNAR